MKKKILIAFSILLALLLVGAAGYAGFASSIPKTPVVEKPQTVDVTRCDVLQSVSAPGKLINTKSLSVELPASGKLEKIFVQPGDRVKAGDVLAKLSEAAKFASTLASAELEMLKAQEALDALTRNAPYKEAQLKANLLNAQDALKTAEEKRARLNYPRASQLAIEKMRGEYGLAEQALMQANDYFLANADRNLTDGQRLSALEMLENAQRQYQKAKANLNWSLGKPSAAEIALADAEVKVARSKVAEAQAALDRLQKGVDPLDQAQARLTLAEAQSKLETAKQINAKGEILASIDGVVLEVNANPDQTFQANTALFKIMDPKALQVEANVTEEDFPLVQPGQEVELFFDARTDLILKGKLLNIIPKRVGSDRALYNVHIALNEVPDGLAEGMTADTAITIAKREGALCLPRAAVRASGSSKISLKLWNGRTTEQRQVEIGLRGNTNIEILSGLKLGDQVVSK
jgi:RND family efflux transporter MFP subunit